MQKVKCPKCSRILGGKATTKKKTNKSKNQKKILTKQSI